MKGFLESERYGKLSREVTLNLLGLVFEPYVFDDIFSEFTKRIKWDNFNELTRIAALLSYEYNKAAEEEEKRKTAGRKLGFANYGRTDPSVMADGFYEERKTVENYIAKFLRDENRTRPKNIKLSFSRVHFSNIDLSKIDFSNSTLKDTFFIKCSVVDSEFNNVSDYEDSSWDETAWWNAQKIDKGLLNFLIKKYPYKKGIKYYNDNTKDDKVYLNAIGRLKVN